MSSTSAPVALASASRTFCNAAVPWLQVVRGLQDRDVAARWGPPWTPLQLQGSSALEQAGYAFVVLHMEQVYNTQTPEPATWLALLDQAIGPGLALADGAVLYPLRDTVEAVREQILALDEHASLGDPLQVYRDGDPVHPAESAAPWGGAGRASGR